MVAADTDGRDDIIGIAYRFIGIGRQGERQIGIQHTRHVAGKAAIDAQLLRVGIHKYKLGNMQITGALGDTLCQEHRADAAAANNSQLHKIRASLCVTENIYSMLQDTS